MARMEAWFDGDAPRGDAEAVFLDAVRGHADDWRAAGLTPACTTTLAVMVPLHLQVDLPGIPRHLVNLQIGFWHDSPSGTGVEGEWGNRYLLDTGGPSSFHHFSGLAEPQELAEVAARWLIQQLARPVERCEWVSSSGDVVGERWTLTDSGKVLAQTGTVRRRLARAAARVNRVR
jgi:hypothetical protein